MKSIYKVFLLMFIVLGFTFSNDVLLSIDGTSLNYTATEDIGGFQFNHDGCAANPSGGDAAAAGFTVSGSSSVVLGFSFTGSVISAGSGTLLDLGGECETITGLVFSSPSGAYLDVALDSDDSSILGCTDESACNYNFDATEDDGSCEYSEENYDCEGNCTNDDFDADGICNIDDFDDDNDGIEDVDDADEFNPFVCTDADGDACDDCSSGSFDPANDGSDNDVDGLCDAGDADDDNDGVLDLDDCDPFNDLVSIEDCAGVCGGSSEEDECGVCNGDGIADGACDCDGNVEDCAGDCGGSAELDECGECNGSGPEENFDCEGNCVVDIDCAGVCGGSSVEDECGVCDGPGLNADGCCGDETTDCAGDCGGLAELDECGVCNGDGIADGACDCEGSLPESCWDGSSTCNNDCTEQPLNYPVEWDSNFDGVLDNYNDYENNGSITARVFEDGIDISSDGDMIAAFVGNEQRGVGVASEVPVFLGGGYAFLTMVYSNETSGETLSFQYYNSAMDEVLDISSTIEFTTNMVEGDVTAPFELVVSAGTVELELNLSCNTLRLILSLID